MSTDPTHTFDPLTPEEARRRLAGYLKTAEMAFPTAWRDLAGMREARGTDVGTWPDWCWLPMAGAVAVATQGTRFGLLGALARLRSTPWGGSTPAVLAALSTWRLGKVVLRFDDHLAQALDETEGIDSVPTDTLLHLPAWCVYVIDDRPYNKRWRLRGWFAHLEWDGNTGRHELRLLFDLDSTRSGASKLIPHIAYLDRDTLRAGIRDMHATASATLATWRTGANVRCAPDGPGERLVAAMFAKVAPCVSRLLYISSEDPDLRDIDDPDATLRRASRGSAKKPWTGATHTAVWEVGYRIGSALRSAPGGSGAGPTSGNSVRPHWRRAHWHTYRVGPGRAERRVLWVAPTSVDTKDAARRPVAERRGD